MKILSNSDWQNKPLPQWIVDKLRCAPLRGEGCHPWLFGMACNLLPWRGESETFQLIRSAITDGRVPDKEIWEAIKNAAAKADLWQPGITTYTTVSKILEKPFDLEEWLKEHSPYEITEEEVKQVSPCHPMLELSGYPAWNASISAAYRSLENVCIQHFSDDRPPQKALSVHAWNKTHEYPGQFVCINPVKSCEGVLKIRADGSEYFSVRCLDNILERRYAPVEFDDISIDRQLRIHSWLSTKLRLLLLVHSGKRSIHGWYLVLGMSEAEVKKLYSFLALLGVDKACSDASRLTRLPGAIRRDKDEVGKIILGSEQRLLYLDGHVSGATKAFQPGLKELALEKGVR